jgi:hypothetical protein
MKSFPAFLPLSLAMLSGIFLPAANGAGPNNTAYGSGALASDTTGNYDSAFGNYALYYNVTGNYNTAMGYATLGYTTGTSNTGFGAQALYLNTSGNYNTAVGNFALYTSSTANYNTAVGYAALGYTVGNSNTATGYEALYRNTSGNFNTAHGQFALATNTSGSNNIGVGFSAGSAIFSGSFNIDIGNTGVNDESNTIRIGNTTDHTQTFVAGIFGKTVGGGTAVYVDSNGMLGTATSSRRFKTDIHDMNAASEAILSLRPVTFHYKPGLAGAGNPQFGLIAEEVAEVNPGLITRDAKGEIYSVRYEAVNAMLLNEFLKQHKRVQEQEKKVSDQEKTIAALQKEIDDFKAKDKNREERLVKLEQMLASPAASRARVAAK